MSKSRVFFIILIAFVAGVFARSFFEINQNIVFFLLILPVAILGIFYKSKNKCHPELDSGSGFRIKSGMTIKETQNETKRNSKVIILSLVLFFFAVGLWKTDLAIKNTQNLAYENKHVEEKAVVQKVSDGTYGQNVIAKLEGQEISALLQVPKYPEYGYGDVLEVSCGLSGIENKNSDFDYRMYLAKDDVLYKCNKSEIRKLSDNKGNFFLQNIFKMRILFAENIRRVIPQPGGSLAEGLLFGGSSGLSEEMREDFSRTGMTHIVAVSGYNVTIIAEYLVIFGIWLGMWRKKAIWFALAGIILFVIMIGFPASGVRAGVMGGTLLWAMKNGRLSSSENAIIFAGAVMLFYNPLLLRWDVGFQLSFLATLGIVLSSPLWEKSFVKKHKALGISEIIAMSISAQIFVLPIIAYNFHIASLISLVANIFILPIVPISMLLVFLTALSGFVFVQLSVVFAWLAHATLAYEISLIRILSEFPWASVSVSSFSAWWIVLYYAMLGMALYRIKKMQIAEFETENDK